MSRTAARASHCGTICALCHCRIALSTKWLCSGHAVPRLTFNSACFRATAGCRSCSARDCRHKATTRSPTRSHSTSSKRNAPISRVDPALEIGALRFDEVECERVGERVVALWRQSLAEQDRQPAVARKQAELKVRRGTACPEQSHFVLKAIRQWHSAQIVPQWLALAAVRDIVEDQEVANSLIMHGRQAVELIGKPGIDRAIRRQRGHEIDKIDDSGLDQEDAGRLERLEKAACQP